jgi:hypothetical protein
MIETYPTDRLYEEVAFVAYHFNWSREEVMGLPHHERQRWCEEISAINDRINEEGPGGAPGDDGGTTLTQEIDFGDPDEEIDF